MEVVSACPLPVGSIVWQTRSRGASLTVVCKATYALCPVESPLAEDQDPLHDADHFWNDDPRQELRLASDLVPFKRRADVLLTGHAYAPRGEPTRSLVARLLVGEIDKAIEVFVDRAFTAAGELREGPRFTVSPLLWRYAAGGADTVNPVGVPPDAPADRYGQRALPRLQPLGLHLRGLSDYLPPVGFGPIAPTWSDRWATLFHHASAWDHLRWRELPLPDDLDGSYFNVAPPDQQVEAIRPNERLVLENLHPQHPRLVTNLNPALPRATVEWPSHGAEDVGFRCDTLWIDTDRCCCSLTWRAVIPLLRGEQPSRVTVRLAAAAREEEPPRSRAGGPLRVVGSPLSGSVLGDLRLGSPSALSPLDLDAVTIDSANYGVLDDETQDRWELPRSFASVMPFSAPTAPLFPAPERAAPAPAWMPEPFTEAPPRAPVTPWSEALPARALVSRPLPEISAPPAPPPMLGPLATLEMTAEPERALPGEALTPTPPPAAEAPIAEVAPALPLDRFPLAACARIAASIARRRPETSAILGEQELAVDVWSALEKHWSAALREEAQRGKAALLRVYDEAYVARLEEERGAITPSEYARLVISVERGQTDIVLAELGLPRGAILRIQRVWLAKIAADAAFNKSVRAAVAAENEGEE